MSEKKKIIVQDVLAMLEDGKTREEIRVEYDISKTEVGLLFKHPKLKGKKTKKPKETSFQIIDEEEIKELPISDDPIVHSIEEKEEVSDITSEEKEEKVIPVWEN